MHGDTRVENCMESCVIVVFFGTQNRIYTHGIKNTLWVQFYARGIIRILYITIYFVHARVLDLCPTSVKFSI